MINIKLASGSPRRKDILNHFKIPFDLISHCLDETTINPIDYKNKVDYVKKLAHLKALSIKDNLNNWILTADTIVVYENSVLNKPQDLKQATQYLKRLSNSNHFVYSAFCLLNRNLNKSYIRCDKATITFNKLLHKDILDYVHHYHPLDKAGAYGIQELPKHFVKKLIGSKYTVIGLPIYQLKSVIKHIHNNTL